MKRLNNLLKAISEINELVAREKSIKNALKLCPSILSAIDGATSRMKMDDETCRHCTKTPHKFVLSLPLIHNGNRGVITIHSSNDFNDDEITLLKRLSKNIAFAISAYKVEEDKREAFNQLATNLMQFEHSADRLSNPLAAIIAYLELRDELDHERLMEIIEESARRIKKELDEMRRDKDIQVNGGHKIKLFIQKHLFSLLLSLILF